METQNKTAWLGWFILVAGWLTCAAFCLLCSIGLEPYPFAYETFFPAIVILLFCNIFVFFFISSRWRGQLKRIAGSTVRIVIGEGLLLAGIFLLGKYAF